MPDIFKKFQNLLPRTDVNNQGQQPHWASHLTSVVKGIFPVLRKDKSLEVASGSLLKRQLSSTLSETAKDKLEALQTPLFLKENPNFLNQTFDSLTQSDILKNSPTQLKKLSVAFLMDILQIEHDSDLFLILKVITDRTLPILTTTYEQEKALQIKELFLKLLFSSLHQDDVIGAAEVLTPDRMKTLIVKLYWIQDNFQQLEPEQRDPEGRPAQQCLLARELTTIITLLHIKLHYQEFDIEPNTPSVEPSDRDWEALALLRSCS